MQKVTHRCDQCGRRISHHDWEDGLKVYGVQVEGSLEFCFDRKTNCGSSSTPHTFVNGGEFCSTKCALAAVTKRLDEATSDHMDWECGVPADDQV